VIVLKSTTGGIHPFVRAKVAGQSIDLVLDTGAIRSILPAEFVRARKLTLSTPTHNKLIVDSNGRVSEMPLVADVPVQFDGESGAGTLDFYVSPSSVMSEGILAPQDIVRSGWALVIDLSREELRYEREESALKRLAGEVSVPLRELDFRRCLVEGLFERAHRVVPVTINGISTELLVDTGASHTALSRNNPATTSMLARQRNVTTTLGIASQGQSSLVPDVSIVMAQTSFTLPVFLQPTSQEHCGRGAVGADLLRHCTLVWGYSSLWAACRAP
jgi:Aspartyl protease